MPSTGKPSPVLMNDFRVEPAELRDAETAAARRVLESGWFILGPEVRAFEAAWAARCDAAHCIGVGNGMDAIEVGLRAAGLEPEAEIITTPMTAFATVLAIMRAGFKPVLADIDPTTALLSAGSAARCLSPRTRAVMPVHLYGRIANMDVWAPFCRNHNLLLFEDCAQAHLAKWNNKPAGGHGMFGAYSFYPTKNLGAIGDGGAIVTSSDELASHARQLRNYGQSERYHHPAIGLNSRLDELQAAILLERLAYLDRFTERRRYVARQYFEQIRNPRVQLLSRPEADEQHVHHLFAIRCGRRDELSRFLKARGIDSLCHYPIPVHLQEPTRSLQRDPQGLEHAERHARECLSIPIHPQMSDADVGRVIEAVNAFA